MGGGGAVRQSNVCAYIACDLLSPLPNISKSKSSNHETAAKIAVIVYTDDLSPQNRPCERHFGRFLGESVTIAVSTRIPKSCFYALVKLLGGGVFSRTTFSVNNRRLLVSSSVVE